MVVIRFRDELIKGHMISRPWDSLEELLSSAPATPPTSFRVRRLGSDAIEEISTSEAKAVFYVDSFDGDKNHQPLHFHARVPIVHGIWIRIVFDDDEVMEGIVNNSMRFLVDSGFFLQPTDPGSNNRLVYVNKRGLKDCRVLGVRNF